ncbi:mechanosensitive ion channel family protein [Breznakiella homolactica]|uniref:Mechanosensitive ion channel family protein n=1 Tax=Breznakiella homolactica TaxID=2798577 RepID=A0A7T7XNQ4_9SPIR|nr:mechanosensitive ion channel family protein [Breznakiella homolactica]QQO09720.1 mechanosensitive ion channel family protein [Breznakiella homolactica]
MDTTAITNAFTKVFRNRDPLDLLDQVVTTVITVFVIIIIFNLIQLFLGKLLKGHVSDQRTFIVKKVIKYLGLVMALLFIFNSMGIDTSAILGAAGIAGIAIGFAAQTSVSSLISGLFLLSEKPFQVGDAITVEDVTGVVLSVDLLSVKLRTYDNTFVRIPNETIIKSNVVTVTRFPIRRLDLKLSVAYKEDLERVQAVLTELAVKNIYCLDNPEPFFGIDSFDSSGITLLFCIWFEKNNYWQLKNSIMIDIKKRFDAENIEIPYQKIDISVKNGTETGANNRII